MKKVITVSVGGKIFHMNEEACALLEAYLAAFREKVGQDTQVEDVMNAIEERIAELFNESAPSLNSVVDCNLVRRVATQLGMPDGTAAFGEGAVDNRIVELPPVHRYYRDPDGKKLGGVCSGISEYLGIDILLVRILAVILFFAGTFGFWLYVALWILAPVAETPTQKCELRGLRPTADNIRRFSNI